MEINRQFLSDLWRGMTGETLVLRIAPLDAPYWGQVWQPVGKHTLVQLREDLLHNPRELLKTFLHEMMHRLRNDTGTLQAQPKTLEAFVASRFDHALKETACEAGAAALMHRFDKHLAAAGLGWDNVTVDLEGVRYGAE